MRFDSKGIFWEEVEREKKASGPQPARVMPPIPKTAWRMPHEFPRLDAASVLSIDVESCDPNLRSEGPGFVRGESFVSGLAVGTDDGHRWYFPMRQELGPNMDPGAVIKWASRELGRTNQPKVGHNLLYDLEALAYEGVTVRGRFHDTSLAEPLLDENKRSYSLDKVAQLHLGEGKDDSTLYEWLSRAYGGAATRRAQIGNVWRGPSALVGLYGEGDVDLPLRILKVQQKLLAEQGLTTVYDMECALIPVLLAMRLRGVRVDVNRAEMLKTVLEKRIKRDHEDLKSVAGSYINVNAPAEIARVFDKAGLEYPRTTVTKAPSFRREWLEAHSHPVAQKIVDIRKWEKFLGTFIEGYILGSHVNGRVHGQFNQLKSDSGGTISGRFSSSNPNLENIPARDEELGPMVRGCFLPEDGEEWGSDDYSQVEYRIICHYGSGDSAESARALYRDDPATDFHNMVVQMTGIPRKRAKSINFGKSYGMGVATAAAQMGVTKAEARVFIETYDQKMPFVGELLAKVSNVAEKRGWIKTLMGRRARFDLWEEKQYGKSGNVLLSHQEAVEKWGANRIKRAATYKALNRLIQGSAADIFKKALLDIWEAGVCDVLGAPLNLVHDEVCWSVPKTKEGREARAEAVNIMQNVVELSVPLLVDTETGPSWGELK